MKFINQTNVFFTTLGISILFVLLASTMQNVNAHQKQLVSIGGKDYLFAVGSANEPVFIDDKSGVEFFAYTPINATDPLNSESNSTIPIQDLEKTLKVEVSAGDHKKVLDFVPVEKDPGHYIAAFFPTVQTTYNYRVFGNVSNIPISLVWTCSPGSVDENTVISNSSVKISDNVVLKDVVGGFSCPEPRADSSFPEKYTSNVDMNNTIMNLQKEISQLTQNNANLSTTAAKINIK